MTYLRECRQGDNHVDTFCFRVVTSVIVRFKEQRYLLVGWFFYFGGTLIPVIGFVQIGNPAMADRYSYIPMQT